MLLNQLCQPLLLCLRPRQRQAALHAPVVGAPWPI
jgi:hypothetical protein